ncbi:DUF1906 domain-containing protein [Paenibacillus frigoriresistens]|uniref:DUF1906 domain-containing protein n=1 Tax=Paenibacillus alginolyticus TaxID=59839 RepID=UPI0015678100|nr:DUF1906 domain-containing protein [Paenibacillus frigoriresistens]NRF91513.1 DUF1906 domain-containing protein [Paenibacillus frigoriresistens]
MIKGFDCATPLTAKTAAAFALDGYSFAARYLVPSGWKALTRSEAELINQAGIDIVSVFETTADRALGGRVAGLADGATAVQVARSVGQPVGSCIYFAVDFEATTAQMQTVIEYIKAASEATPEYTTGVYGSYAVIEAISQTGACSRFWQTRAWSYGKKSAAANIYQYDCGPQGLGLTINGIGVDLNEGYGNEGLWNNLKEEEVMLKVEDANKIIAVLKAVYELAPNPEIGRLADEIRVVSGQPKENS